MSKGFFLSWHGNTQLTYFNGDFLKYGRLYSGSLTAGLVFITALPRNIYNHYKRMSSPQ